MSVKQPQTPLANQSIAPLRFGEAKRKQKNPKYQASRIPHHLT